MISCLTIVNDKFIVVRGVVKARFIFSARRTLGVPQKGTAGPPGRVDPAARGLARGSYRLIWLTVKRCGPGIRSRGYW